MKPNDLQEKHLTLLAVLAALIIPGGQVPTFLVLVPYGNAGYARALHTNDLADVSYFSAYCCMISIEV